MTAGRVKVGIASPCTESWEKMEGDERQRFCARCQLNVYNLSMLTIGELESLVEKTEGRMCGRLYQRRDGTALTRDCPVGLRRARIQLAAGLSTAVAFLCAVFLTVPQTSTARPISFSRSMSYWNKMARQLPVLGDLIRLIDPPSEMGGLGAMDVVPAGSKMLTTKTLRNFGQNNEAE